MELTQIFTIAAKEFRDRMRNRWVLAVALVFTVFSLVIAYFGGAQQGAVGFRSIEFTIASLVSLVIYLIPLIALLLGFDAIVGDRGLCAIVVNPGDAAERWADPATYPGVDVLAVAHDGIEHPPREGARCGDRVGCRRSLRPLALRGRLGSLRRGDGRTFAGGRVGRRRGVGGGSPLCTPRRGVCSDLL